MPLPENMVGDLGMASADPEVPVISMFEARAGFFSQDKTHNGGPDSNANKWGEIFIGPALSGSQPHAHTAAWNILVFGKKRWYIWPKVCYSLGYADGHGMSVWEWAVTRLPKLKGTPCAPFEFEQGSVIQ